MHPEDDIERFREHYSAMSDAELEQIANSSDELIDAAETALLDELSRRNLPLPDEDEAAQVSPQYSRPVTVRTFLDLSEALLAKGKLEAAGIRAELPDVNMARMNWFWSNMLGGVRL